LGGYAGASTTDNSGAGGASTWDGGSSGIGSGCKNKYSNCDELVDQCCFDKPFSRNDQERLDVCCDTCTKKD